MSPAPSFDIVRKKDAAMASPSPPQPDSSMDFFWRRRCHDDGSRINCHRIELLQTVSLLLSLLFVLLLGDGDSYHIFSISILPFSPIK